MVRCRGLKITETVVRNRAARILELLYLQVGIHRVKWLLDLIPLKQVHRYYVALRYFFDYFFDLETTLRRCPSGTESGIPAGSSSRS